jgi:DNA repair protein RadC
MEYTPSHISIQAGKHTMKTKETAASYRITDLNVDDRPRERLRSHGAQALHSAELIAILLRVGMQGENAVQVGERLLHDCGGLTGLHKITIDELCQMRGIGEAKAAQIKAAIELGRRLAQATPDEKPAVHSPADAANLVMYEMNALEQEELWVLHLDTRNRLVDRVQTYKGSLNASSVRIGELFKGAIRKNSASIIVIHNHPSGDPTPSPEDIAMTRALVKAGRLLDIDVLDHLVIGGNRYISLKERGLGFSEST